MFLQQLKWEFKPKIKWNKYQSNATTQNQNQYLDYLIDLRFQGLNSFLFNHLKIIHNEQDKQDIFLQKEK